MSDPTLLKERNNDLQTQADLLNDAQATLVHDSARLKMNPLLLTFSSRRAPTTVPTPQAHTDHHPGMEQEYITDCAKRRWPVLLFVFCFDVLSLVLRSIAKLLTSGPAAVAREMGPQLLNMAVLYTLVGLVNRRSRQGNPLAARQEEVVLGALMDAAVTFLLSSLTRDNAQDYVFVAFFLITTTTFLCLRWHVGASLLALPVVLATAHTWQLLPDWVPGAWLVASLCLLSSVFFPSVFFPLYVSFPVNFYLSIFFVVCVL